MKSIGYIATTALLMFYAALMNGWALSTLWGWFVAPVFGLTLITIPQAVGISMIVGYTTHQSDLKPNGESWGDALVRAGLYATIKPIMALAFGLIVRLWM